MNGTLALIAQRWADQCPHYHDKNRKVLGFEQQPGQNLADSWSSKNGPNDYELERKIQSWYDEVQNWPVENTPSFTNQGTSGSVGHFTQVVWAETQFIGCGVVYYKDLAQPKYPYRKVILFWCIFSVQHPYYNRPFFDIPSPSSPC